MELIKNGKSLMNVCIKENACDIINRAALDFVDAVYAVTGVKMQIDKVKCFCKAKNSVVIGLFDQSSFKEDFKAEYDFTLGTDGFAVMEKNGNLYLLGHLERGAFYAAHDVLEKNADIIWARGALEYGLEVLKTDSITLSKINYAEKSPFKVRVWNTCGHGTADVDHGDKGTAMCLGRNKIIGVYHHCDDDWYEYAVTGQSLASPEYRAIEELADTHPEYFMTYEDGTPRKNKLGGSMLESYLNYYNPEVPKIIAKKIVKYIKEKCHEGDVIGYNMPDNPYFFMMQDGVRLHEQPFTTDCGVTVYPEQKNYKSTVYFNFINRLIKEINELLPNTIIHTQAYMYSEVAPAIKVDSRVMIKVAPLTSNMKVAQNDPTNPENYHVRDNLIEWTKRSESVCVNAYWNSFRGDYYSRPITYVAQQDLKFWKEIGVVGFTPEGKVDCSKLESYNDKQKFARTFFDFNEMYTWQLCKLMWNPDQSIADLKEKYIKIVYKECYDEMKEYYDLVEGAYNKADGYVWVLTGADVYVYQYMIKAGISEKVIKTLEKALAKVTTETVKDRIESMLSQLKKYFDLYDGFIDEDADVLWCGGVNPLSAEQLDYESNKDSIWNKARKSEVLKNFRTQEDMNPAAKCSRRMLYDENNFYLGYELYDDVVKEEVIEGQLRALREDGSEINFRAESYFGGNVLNTEKYYGYTSGFNKGDAKDHYYVNEGVPHGIAFPEGVTTVKKVFLSNNKEERKLFFVQVVPLKVLDVNLANFKPYGHFAVYTDKFGQVSWKGFGLWAKANFCTYKLIKED